MSEEVEANPVGEPAEGFREDKLRQLKQEIDQRQPEPAPASETESPETEEQEAPEVESQTESKSLEEPEGQPEGEEEEEASEEPIEGEDAEDEEAESEWQAKVEEAREQAEKAEANLRSFERDYRKKTTAIAEKQRALDEDRSHLEEFGRQLVYQKQSALNEYSQVPWGELQVNDPQRYAQLKAQHDQVAREAQFEQQRFQSFMQQKQAQEEANRKFRIENSKSILQRAIPDWGPEKYKQVRDYAIANYGYTDEALDSLDDWSVMLPLHDAMVAGQVKKEAPKVLKKLGKRRSKRPGRTAGGQPRNAQGQYRAAAAESQKRPGDKAAWREATRLRLEAERRR